MNKYIIGSSASFSLCFLCLLLAVKSPLYSFWDVGSYGFAGIGLGCLMIFFRPR